MGRSYGLGEDIDEADLDAELSMLEDELEGLGESEAAGVPDYMPTAPSAVSSSFYINMHRVYSRLYTHL
jgi:hypothetical protein